MIFVDFPAIFDHFHDYFATWSKYFATWYLFRGSGALPRYRNRGGEHDDLSPNGR